MFGSQLDSREDALQLGVAILSWRRCFKRVPASVASFVASMMRAFVFVVVSFRYCAAEHNLAEVQHGGAERSGIPFAIMRQAEAMLRNDCGAPCVEVLQQVA